MILTVDSSTNIASVSLIHNGDILYSFFIDDGKTHSQKLMPMIDECFKASGYGPQDMDVFAVISGPGSFTGLRIGIATVQGLAYSSSKPCIAITALDAMAYGAKKFEGLIAPLIDARNTQAYYAVYDGTNSLKKIINDTAGPIEQIVNELSTLNRNVFFIGDGATKNSDIINSAFSKSTQFLEIGNDYTTLKGAALLAQKYFDENNTVKPRDLIPYYFRDTSAKKKFK